MWWITDLTCHQFLVLIIKLGFSDDAGSHCAKSLCCLDFYVFWEACFSIFFFCIFLFSFFSCFSVFLPELVSFLFRRGESIIHFSSDDRSSPTFLNLLNRYEAPTPHLQGGGTHLMELSVKWYFSPKYFTFFTFRVLPGCCMQAAIH